MAKELRKICCGLARARDVTWFTELSDKGMLPLEIIVINETICYSARSTKVHLYWCMRNCGGNPDRLRAMIMNISKHFQVCMCTYVCICVCVVLSVLSDWIHACIVNLCLHSG